MTNENENKSRMAEAWFDGLNAGDMERLLRLFARTTRIRNAAAPLLEGPDAPRRLLEDFFARTERRTFLPLDLACAGKEVFASWMGRLTFRTGITLRDVTLTGPLTVTLRGVDRFLLDDHGLVTELDIAHETTTAYVAARQQGAGAGGAPLPSVMESRVREYFAAEEAGDIDRAAALFAVDAVVRNAAQPPYGGIDGVRRYVADFTRRTESRVFELHRVAVEGTGAFAWWTAVLRFRAGIAFGPTVTKRSFDAQVNGGCAFRFDGDSLITDLLVAHETASVSELAAQAAH